MKTKRLIAKRHHFGDSIDTGWRIYPPDGSPVDVYWGNTKDGASLTLLIEDGRRQGYDFIVDETVIAFLSPVDQQRYSFEDLPW